MGVHYFFCVAAHDRIAHAAFRIVHEDFELAGIYVEQREFPASDGVGGAVHHGVDFFVETLGAREPSEVSVPVDVAGFSARGEGDFAAPEGGESLFTFAPERVFDFRELRFAGEENVVYGKPLGRARAFFGVGNRAEGYFVFPRFQRGSGNFYRDSRRNPPRLWVEQNVFKARVLVFGGLLVRYGKGFDGFAVCEHLYFYVRACGRLVHKAHFEVQGLLGSRSELEGDRGGPEGFTAAVAVVPRVVEFGFRPALERGVRPFAAGYGQDEREVGGGIFPDFVPHAGGEKFFWSLVWVGFRLVEVESRGVEVHAEVVEFRGRGVGPADLEDVFSPRGSRRKKAGEDRARRKMDS